MTFDPKRILETLAGHEVQFVLIGAFAAVAQGWQEPTADIDITPLRTGDNLRRLAKALIELDAVILDNEGRPDTNHPIDDQTLRLRGRTLCSTSMGDVDIVVNPAGADGYEDIARDGESVDMPIGGATVRVLMLDRIIASKRATDRAKDRAAIPSLEELARRESDDA